MARKQTRKAAGTRRATKKTAKTAAKSARKPAGRKTTARGHSRARKTGAGSGSSAKRKTSAKAKTAAKKAPARRTRKAPAKSATRRKTAARAAATRARRSRPAPKPASRIETATATVRGAISGMVAAVADRLPWTGSEPDAVNILEKEHRRFEELLRQGEDTTERARQGRRELLDTLSSLLDAHELMEEKVLYPALQSHPEARAVVLEGFEEHHLADVIVRELRSLAPDDEQWGAKFKVLKENIEHHIQEEEGEMFRVARRIFSRDELRDLAERMLAVRPAG